MPRSAEFHRNRRKLLAQEGVACVVCGDSELLQADHIVPLEQGGTDGLENLQALCETHHKQKTAQEHHGNPSAQWMRAKNSYAGKQYYRYERKRHKGQVNPPKGSQGSGS